MHIFTSHYYQQGRNYGTLLLQQYQYHCIPVCLLCLCHGENETQGKAGAYFTGRLLQWFRAQSLRHLVKSTENRLPILQDQLRELIEDTDKELKTSRLVSEEKNMDLAGILCVGEYFLLFFRGRQKIYLLNRSWGRGHIRCVSDEMAYGSECDPVLRQGILQRDVGILLAAGSFCGHMTEQELRECLHVETVLSEEQAERHLRELAWRGEMQGGRNMTAALLLARSDT